MDTRVETKDTRCLEKDPMLILKSRTFPKTHKRIYDARSFRIGSRDLKRQLALSLHQACFIILWQKKKNDRTHIN